MPILDSNSLEFFSHSPEQTRRVGIRMGSYLQNGDIICLQGDLGSGKTTLVQGIAKGWGTSDSVTSPSYVLVNEYRHPDGNKLFHLDAYRLSGALEAEMLDFEYLITNGTVIIEWAERIKEILPPDHLWIQMQWMSVEQRHLLITPRGKRYVSMIQRLRHFLYGAL